MSLVTATKKKKTRRPKSLKRTQQQKIEKKKKNSTKSKTKKRETKLEGKRAARVFVVLFSLCASTSSAMLSRALLSAGRRVRE